MLGVFKEFICEINKTLKANFLQIEYAQTVIRGNNKKSYTGKSDKHDGFSNI